MNTVFPFTGKFLFRRMCQGKTDVDKAVSDVRNTLSFNNLAQCGKRTNVHIHLSPFIHDSRIFKETKSLVGCGMFDRAFIIAKWETGLKEREDFGTNRLVWRVPLKSRKLPQKMLFHIIKYIEWIVRIVAGLQKENITVIQGHRVSSLPVSIILKRLHNARLVYDARELETEVHGVPGLRKQLFRLVERALIRYADEVITVSDSIADWYARQYRMNRPVVVRNVPEASPEINRASRVLREKIPLKETDFLFLYQGGLSPGRGIKRLLRVFSQAEEDRHIVFMGFGHQEQDVREYTSKYPNIHFYPPVRPDEVLTYTASADVGIYLMKNTCLNHYYSLPNKIFEFLMAGLPIIIPKFPEMSRLVNKFDCGWKVPEDDAGVVALVNSITRKEVETKRKGALLVASSFGWHEEEKKLLEVYRLLPKY